MSVVGLGVAALKLFAPAVDVPGPEASDDPDDTVVFTLPERLGGLLATMEHAVVGAVAGATTAFAHMAAWTVAMTDQHVIALPSDRVADGLLRAQRAVTPVVGIGLGRIVWILLALLGVAALAHALWPGA